MSGFINEKVALLAKEKGFDWTCDYVYTDDNDSPYKLLDHHGYNGTIKNSRIHEKDYGDEWYKCTTTDLYDFQHWLRQEHDIHVYANYYTFSIPSCNGYYFHIGKNGAQPYIQGHSDDYGIALNKGFLEALKLIK